MSLFAERGMIVNLVQKKVDHKKKAKGFVVIVLTKNLDGIWMDGMEEFSMMGNICISSGFSLVMMSLNLADPFNSAGKRRPLHSRVEIKYFRLIDIY